MGFPSAPDAQLANAATRIQYVEPEPDGYMSMLQLVAFFERYATSFAAPMELGTTVVGVEQVGARFRVQTNRGVWLADNGVIATG